MNKPFLTYQEQIDLLKSRGMIIESNELAHAHLEKIGYFNLINGYKDVFLTSNSPSEVFSSDTKFHNIYRLYNFDKELRAETLKRILSIENSVKAIIAYDFAEKYGEIGYKSAQAFSLIPENKLKVSKLIINIEKSISNWQADPSSHFDCIRHYLVKHGEIPIWVLFNFLTFGTISKFFTLLQPSIKTQIVEHLNKVFSIQINSQIFSNYLRILVLARNICAHGQRLYNFNTKIVFSSKHKTIIELNKNNISKIKSLDKLLIIFSDFLSKQDFIDYGMFFATNLSEMLKDIKNEKVALRLVSNISWNIDAFLTILNLK